MIFGERLVAFVGQFSFKTEIEHRPNSISVPTMQEAAVYSIVNPVWGEEKRRIKNRKNKYECVVAAAETYRNSVISFSFERWEN